VRVVGGDNIIFFPTLVGQPALLEIDSRPSPPDSSKVVGSLTQCRVVGSDAKPHARENPWVRKHRGSIARREGNEIHSATKGRINPSTCSQLSASAAHATRTGVRATSASSVAVHPGTGRRAKQLPHSRHSGGCVTGRG